MSHDGKAVLVLTVSVLLLVSSACSKSVQSSKGMMDIPAQSVAKQQPPIAAPSGASGQLSAGQFDVPQSSRPGETASVPAAVETPAPEVSPAPPMSTASVFPSLTEPARDESLGTGKDARELRLTEDLIAPGPGKEPQEQPPAERQISPDLGKSEQELGSAQELMISKAEPSQAARRRAEEIQHEQLAAAAAGLQDVFFGFDSWQLTEEAKQILAQDAERLKGSTPRKVVIEGHCDERGTQAYNLVLGEKRAKAIRNYLIELGVMPDKLTIVSYGKERPFCREHDESCYQQNRRGHLVMRAE